MTIWIEGMSTNQAQTMVNDLRTEASKLADAANAAVDADTTDANVRYMTLNRAARAINDEADRIGELIRVAKRAAESPEKRAERDQFFGTEPR
jgi:hypothetical protein